MKVLISLKIFPKDFKAIAELKRVLMETLKPERLGEEPIAFGFKALILEKIVDETEVEEFEEKIKQIKGVQEVQLIRINKLLSL